MPLLLIIRIISSDDKNNDATNHGSTTNNQNNDQWVLSSKVHRQKTRLRQNPLRNQNLWTFIIPKYSNMNYLQRILGILFSVDDFRFVVCMDTILSFFNNKHCKNYLALRLPSPGQFFLHEQTVNKKMLKVNGRTQ